MLILIAGPYRSSTQMTTPNRCNKIRVNLESVALPLFRLGHIPMIGEWVALPLLHLVGSTRTGDEAYEEILYPVAQRLLSKSTQGKTTDKICATAYPTFYIFNKNCR